jgi:hypothetical protein
MNLTPYRAFGLVFLINTHHAGERYKTIINKPDCTIFCVEGLQICTNINTGERMPDYEKRWFHSPDINYIKGEFQLDVIEDTTIFCYDPKSNFNRDQKFDTFIIDGGSETILKKGTKLLLCKGTLNIEGKVFNAPSRIFVESGDRLATSVTECLGLIVL